MVIYKTINLLNGKWYIGKDVKGFPGYMGSGLHIKAAIAKYGKENFKKEILQVCSSKEELCEAEKEWTLKTNATNDPNAYNLAEGGQGGDLSAFMNFEKRKGKKIHSDEHKQKLSERWSGDNNPSKQYKMSEEHKEKLRKANRERKYVCTDEQREHLRKINIGKKLSEETKNKMSESRKGKKKPGVTVYVIDTEENEIPYNSIRDAAAALNISYKKAYGLSLGRTYENLCIKLIRK